MYKLVDNLIVYRGIPEDSILKKLSSAIKKVEKNEVDNETGVGLIYHEVNRLLDISTTYGFDKNLWHNYLAFLLATVETPFSLTCEKSEAPKGTVDVLAKNDFRIFKKLFDYNFSALEDKLGISIFDYLENYQAVPKKERAYNKNVSEKVRKLSEDIEKAADENEIFDAVTSFYSAYGVGLLGLNKAFRLMPLGEDVKLIPITNTENVRLSDIVGYERQKRELIKNTETFANGEKSNNCLLYGDAGTGKSTSIKAILNEYYDKGLRIIEIYKHQFKYLSTVISKIKNRNYRFIIYMDDLSFEEFEIEYKYLKAVIEGGIEIKPDNILIYATSNRRHLIRELYSDRKDEERISDDELHHSDTMQEKISLVARFGLQINYGSPNQDQYFEIVKNIAARYPEIQITEKELLDGARMFELGKGGRSGRTAEQYVISLLGNRIGNNF